MSADSCWLFCGMEQTTACLLSEAVREISPVVRVEIVSSPHHFRAFLQRRFPYREAPEVDVVVMEAAPFEEGNGLLAWLKSDPFLKRIPRVVLCDAANQALSRWAEDVRPGLLLPLPFTFEEQLGTARRVHDFWASAMRADHRTGEGAHPMRCDRRKPRRKQRKILAFSQRIRQEASDQQKIAEELRLKLRWEFERSRALQETARRLLAGESAA